MPLHYRRYRRDDEKGTVRYRRDLSSVPRVKSELRPISEIYHPSSVPELLELELCTLYAYPSLKVYMCMNLLGHPVRYVLIYLLCGFKYIGSISGTADGTRMAFFGLGRKSDDMVFSDATGVPPRYNVWVVTIIVQLGNLITQRAVS
jgi:hypothetical protein